MSARDEVGRTPRLVLMSGLPGAGKSTIAEAVGERLGIPVFSLDWLLGAAMQAAHAGADLQGLNAEELGRRLLLMLAHRQFLLKQSAILDAPGHEPAWRDPFVELAATDGAALRVVEVQCLDEGVHRARVVGRLRGIPGWHEFNWSHVERMKVRWRPWPLEIDRLVVDSTKPLAAELHRVAAYIGGPSG